MSRTDRTANVRYGLVSTVRSGQQLHGSTGPCSVLGGYRTVKIDETAISSADPVLVTAMKSLLDQEHIAEARIRRPGVRATATTQEP